MAVSAWDRVQMAKYSAYRWRCQTSITQKVLLALGMAAVVGLAAQVRLALPFTPVPITMQTLAAMLAGVLLGRNWGGISMVIYAGLGAAGLPWFIGWSGGISHIAGPTGGYIIGFILAAMFMGYFTDKYVRSRNFVSMFGLMLVANFVLIYLPGLAQLGLWLNLVKGQAVGWSQVLVMGLYPFIAGEIVKIGIAAVVARGITPKQAYNSEADQGRWSRWRLP
ncbi:MAG: biotin transporter BioY [Dehalococcoidales bacterium]|jgi:biotin transport system substrate-specific component